MGIPEHYSRDIALRCEVLLRELLPIVRNGLPGDRRFGGPLDTTFLLAMATPMIVLPIERIFKPAAPSAAASDDRDIDPAFTRDVDDVLGPLRRFADAPFFQPNRWSYIHRSAPFPVAKYWPHDVLERLSTEAAFADADVAPTRRIMLDLRNALAHGGIAFLDDLGRSTNGRAAMLAFASANTDRGRVVSLNLLRVHQDDFVAFVLAWADWLSASPARHTLNAWDPLAA